MANLPVTIKLSFTKKLEGVVVGMLMGSLFFIILLGLIFFQVYQNKFYPGIIVDEYEIKGLTLTQAATKLQSLNKKPFDHQIIVHVDNIEVSSSSAQLGAELDYQPTLEQALKTGRQGSLIQRAQTILGLLINPAHFSSQTKYDSEKLELMIAQLKTVSDIEGHPAFIELGISQQPQSLTINPGSPGREILIEQTTQRLEKKLSEQSTSLLSTTTAQIRVAATVASTSARLGEEQQQAALERAKLFVGQQAVFSESYLTIKLTDQDMIDLLTFPSGISQERLTELVDDWKQKIDRPPQNAEFEYDAQTLVVTKFVPHRDGLTLDIAKTEEQIQQQLTAIEAIVDSTDNDPTEYTLHLIAQPPDVTLAETNDLGISELIGFGDSYYAHSIPNRIHNVALTTEKLSYYIIKPGEEFSFNKALGEVSSRTGFKSAYIIKDGQTVLGDGGGVCQVSTTLFRALLDAGLEITKRKPHSYRVSYYELNRQPGYDATVYSGDVDLRFVNDTDQHILIYGETDSENLYMKMELYGTSDGRTTEIVDYQSWGYRLPPPAQYIPDPSLAPGQLRQIDWSASGIKAKFTNVVRDKFGNIIHQDEYYSSYRPWSAKYLQGV